MIAALLWTGLAWAQETPVAASEAEFARAPLAGRPVFDLRVGFAPTQSTGHPYICAEGAPLPWLSLEGCGTGSGVLHQADEPDMAHFRTRARVLSHEDRRVDAEALVGVGFAEVQSGRDAAGFRFGEATDGAQVEAAGPEISAGGKARLWVDRRAYLVLDATAGVAHIPAAPVVIGHGGALVPFAAITAGFGF